MNINDLLKLSLTDKQTGRINQATPKPTINHVFTGDLNICTTCLRDRAETNHIEIAPTIFNPAGQKVNGCKSHVCPSCLTKWEHDYSCNHTRSGLCSRCASQTAAEINRPAKLEEIKKQHYITPQEASGIQCEHEAVVYNMIYEVKSDSTKILRENWQSLISDHLLNLEQMIERTRNKVEATRKLRAKTEIEDMNKLTDEEKEQYRRSAQKLKKVNVEKKEKEKVKAKDNREYQINKAAALLQAMNPKLSLESAKKRAELMYEEIQ